MTFSFTYQDETVTKDSLSKIKPLAKSRANRDRTEVTIQDDATGTVAFVATYVEGRYFAPFERVEQPRQGVQVPDFPGFVFAYRRHRIGATVLRGQEEFDKKGQWLVHDGRTGGHVIVESTKAANEVTKEMRQGRTL